MSIMCSIRNMYLRPLCLSALWWVPSSSGGFPGHTDASNSQGLGLGRTRWKEEEWGQHGHANQLLCQTVLGTWMIFGVCRSPWAVEKVLAERRREGRWNSSNVQCIWNIIKLCPKKKGRYPQGAKVEWLASVDRSQRQVMISWYSMTLLPSSVSSED